MKSGDVLLYVAILLRSAKPATFNDDVHVVAPLNLVVPEQVRLPLITVDPSYAIVHLSVPKPSQLALNRNNLLTVSFPFIYIDHP